MADTPQGLKEFTQNLRSDLESGTISVHEAIVAASQYAYLRDAIHAKSDALSNAELAGEEVLVSALQSVVAEVLEGITDLPNFQNQAPDVPVEETLIRTTATLRKHATERIQEAVQTGTGPHKEKRRAFIHDLVTKFSSTIPTNEDQISTAFDASVVQAAAAEPSNASGRLIELLVDSAEASGRTITKEQKRLLQVGVREAVESNNDYITSVTGSLRQNRALYKTLLENPDIKRPDVLIDIALNAPPSETPGETLTRATKLAQVAQSLDAAKGSSQGGRIQFFSSDAAKGVAAGIQKGADGILSLVGEPVRDMVLHEKTNGVFRAMLSSPQKFIDRLGENFVRSALFTHITQDLTKQLSEKPVSGQARSAFDDVFSSIFRGPIMTGPLTKGAEGKLLDFLELARANAAAPKGRGFLPQDTLPWEVFRVRGSLARGYSGGRALSPLSWFPKTGLASFGDALGNMFSGIVDRSTSFILSSPRIARQMTGSRRAAALPIPLGQDMPLFVALVVVIILVLLFIFPSFLNLPQTAHSAKVSSIFSALIQKDVTTEPDILCTDCKWPTNGCISQGPQGPSAVGGSHDQGDDANAVDIAATLGTPIISITDGVVEARNDGCVNFVSPKCGDGYGNYVDIRSSDGKLYRYAHMIKGSPAADDLKVKKGTKIGLVDSSGYSTGNHLHIELRPGQSGSINDILPVDVPSCVNQFIGPNNCKDAMGGKSCVTIK